MTLQQLYHEDYTLWLDTIVARLRSHHYAVKIDDRVKNVSFDENSITVFLMNGRAISVPLVWYPRLYHATPEQREAWEICGGGYGLHWQDINEDLSMEGMLRGGSAPVAQNQNC